VCYTLFNLLEPVKRASGNNFIFVAFKALGSLYFLTLDKLRACLAQKCTNPGTLGRGLLHGCLNSLPPVNMLSDGVLGRSLRTHSSAPVICIHTSSSLVETQAESSRVRFPTK
jgi:hypothetical protein